jgi:hypothetical protein
MVLKVDMPCLALSVVDIVEAQVVTVELSAVHVQMSPLSSDASASDTDADAGGSFQSEAALPNESPMLLL